MSKEDNKVGYEFEAELKAILTKVQAKSPIFWHQFPDAKAARGFLQAQPSDFLVATKKDGAMLLEVKASVEKPSLTKAMIRPSQIGAAIKWIRAGQKSMFLFYCQLDNTVQAWDGDYIVSCISNNQRFDKRQCEQFDYFNLENWITTRFTQ